MLFLIYYPKDLASMNILRGLLEELEFEKSEPFYGLDSWEYGEKVKIVGINKEHIFYNFLDEELRSRFQEVSGVIFLSRHRSASGKRSLTVHPVGNFSEEAEYGGLPKALSPAFPELMSECLRILRREGKGSEYTISFEVTHHGPYLEVPTFFVEIGSDEDAWRDEEAGKIWGSSLAHLLEEYLRGIERKEAYIGVGGGHYAPRFSDITCSKGVDFGHMISNYSLSPEALRLAFQRTPRASGAYIYKKVKKVCPEIFREAERLGLKVFEV